MRFAFKARSIASQNANFWQNPSEYPLPQKQTHKKRCEILPLINLPPPNISKKTETKTEKIIIIKYSTKSE